MIVCVCVCVFSCISCNMQKHITSVTMFVKIDWKGVTAGFFLFFFLIKVELYLYVDLQVYWCTNQFSPLLMWSGGWCVNVVSNSGKCKCLELMFGALDCSSSDGSTCQRLELQITIQSGNPCLLCACKRTCYQSGTFCKMLILFIYFFPPNMKLCACLVFSVKHEKGQINFGESAKHPFIN